MKKIKLILPIIIVLFTSCNTSQQSTYDKSLREAYVYGFKITYFKRLLLQGFNECNEIKAVLRMDASKGLADMPPTPDDLQVIDSFVRIGNAQMVKDSLQGFNRAEGAQGKRIFSFAIERFNSKWLDSLARARYKISFGVH